MNENWNTANDFIEHKGEEVGNKELSGLVKAIFDTDVGKNRKASLTATQAVAIARARAFAEAYEVPVLDMLCDVLADTSISIKGEGMKQLVTVLSARLQVNDESAKLDRLQNRLMG